MSSMVDPMAPLCFCSTFKRLASSCWLNSLDTITGSVLLAPKYMYFRWSGRGFRSEGGCRGGLEELACDGGCCARFGSRKGSAFGGRIPSICETSCGDGFGFRKLVGFGGRKMFGGRRMSSFRAMSCSSDATKSGVCGAVGFGGRRWAKFGGRRWAKFDGRRSSVCLISTC